MPERFQQRPDIVTRHIAGETLLVPISGQLADMEQLFSLNDVGAFIWERLDGMQDLAGIQAQLLDAFEVEPRQADADLSSLVRELLEAGLIERHD